MQEGITIHMGATQGRGTAPLALDDKVHTHLKDSEWGQMGVKRIAGTFGCTMEPPAATE